MRKVSKLRGSFGAGGGSALRTESSPTKLLEKGGLEKLSLQGGGPDVSLEMFGT